MDPPTVSSSLAFLQMFTVLRREGLLDATRSQTSSHRYHLKTNNKEPHKKQTRLQTGEQSRNAAAVDVAARLEGRLFLVLSLRLLERCKVGLFNKGL